RCSEIGDSHDVGSRIPYLIEAFVSAVTATASMPMPKARRATTRWGARSRQTLRTVQDRTIRSRATHRGSSRHNPNL
ncbi:hypothetical protein ACU7M1_32450, partial [Burkholderia pseudomallei]|uniref:hypothetical protein n=1 Tax=Burkholderia pseudomallei TaxID=28450 RepID=UPI00406CB33E